MSWSMVRAAAALALLGCTGGTDPDDTGTKDTETDTDTDADADADADADTDADTDVEPGQSLVQRVGSGVVGADYVGTEEYQLLDDEGYGALQCQITLDLLSTGIRTDCAPCLWAFDLEISNATVVLDDGAGACMAGFGLDATTVGSLNGQILSYGYNPDYFGHAQVLMVSPAGEPWAAATYGTYDEGTGDFSYEWVDGLIEY
ncbi:MAG: hypothetical protein ABMA64_24315 [Myxococcota bacterium]